LRLLFLLTALGCSATAPLLSNSAHAGALSGIQRFGTDDSPGVDELLVPDGLDVGANVWVDLAVPYVSVPSGLVGADYIQMVEADKTDADYQLEVTLSEAARLYLFIDDRVGDDNIADPPTLVSVMTWVDALGFVATTLDVDSTFLSPHSVFFADFPEGTVLLGEQDDGDFRSMYLIASAVPEPTPTWLLATGALVLLGVHRLRIGRAGA